MQVLICRNLDPRTPRAGSIPDSFANEGIFHDLKTIGKSQVHGRDSDSYASRTRRYKAHDDKLSLPLIKLRNALALAFALWIPLSLLLVTAVTAISCKLVHTCLYLCSSIDENLQMVRWFPFIAMGTSFGKPRTADASSTTFKIFNSRSLDEYSRKIGLPYSSNSPSYPSQRSWIFLNPCYARQKIWIFLEEPQIEFAGG